MGKFASILLLITILYNNSLEFKNSFFAEEFEIVNIKVESKKETENSGFNLELSFLNISSVLFIVQNLLILTVGFLSFYSLLFIAKKAFIIYRALLI